MTPAGRSARPAELAGAAGSRRKKERQPLDQQQLERAALAYVNRFDCTASKLTRYLQERVRKCGSTGDYALWIRELVQRYLGSGILNDARFAKNLASQLGGRGKSARAIAQKLSLRGVPEDVASRLMSERRQEEPDAELEAALTYIRKRRLGTYRSSEKQAEYRNKDLASLARQGFSFDVARRALDGKAGTSGDEF